MPSLPSVISAAECKEEVERADGKFTVFMYCNRCNHRMDKLTINLISRTTLAKVPAKRVRGWARCCYQSGQYHSRVFVTRRWCGSFLGKSI